MNVQFTVSHGSVNMASREGKKNLTLQEKEDIKALISYCERFRFDEEKTKLHLEDKGINISRTTLYELKKEMRKDISKRFEDIGNHELAYEYDMALSILKELEPRVWSVLNDSESEASDILRASQELRSIKADLVNLYGKQEIVKNVVGYFEEKYGEKAREAIDAVGKKQ